MSDETSCSDCKLEIIELKWTELLLNWLDKCVIPNEINELNVRSLVEIINKYKEDICHDDLDKAILCTDDVEPFINYKFPILRLRNLFKVEEYPKKLYIMTSILLYYCCINSKSGKVDADICAKLTKEEQTMILRFCETLSGMEATINNIDTAIKAACESELNTMKVDPKEIYKKYQNDPGLLEPSISSRTNHKTKVIEKRTQLLQFKSSITVLPSVVTDTSLSKSSFEVFSDVSDFKVAYSRIKRDQEVIMSSDSKDTDDLEPFQRDSYEDNNKKEQSSSDHVCQPDCDCTRCSAIGPCCGDPGCTKELCDDDNLIKQSEKMFNCTCRDWKFYAIIFSAILLVMVIIFSTIPLWIKKDNSEKIKPIRVPEVARQQLPEWGWQCRNHFCHKVFLPFSNKSMYSSLSRCTLLCTGPQLWPHPIGYTHFSKTIVVLSTSKLEYKFPSLPSDSVHQYLAEAFKLFLKDLARLEKIDTKSKNENEDLSIKKMIIQMDVESDLDPRLRLNTEEAYTLKVDTIRNQVLIKVSAVSFCGVRHGLETLSQLILVDQSTGYLITLSNMIIKDAPTYKYRGLMIDTGRNFVPVVDLMKTIDAMATCKLNTFHWRISDATSFPLNLVKLPEFFEFGPYDRSMVYTKDDVKSIVKRAGIRGIRVLIEVAAPGPVGRPWSWSPSANCPKKTDNLTCNNVLCIRLNMDKNIFDVLQIIYSEIIEMTNVDDIFHLSDSVFSLASCYYLIDDREGFLDKALVRLKIANKGFLPKLPIIWYTSHLTRDMEAKTWDRLGVQLNDWDPNHTDGYLSKFKVIHSTKWDLSCEMRKQRCTRYRTWQEMYAWKSWRNIDVFTIEGGESILWTDLVDSGNLDYHLWPRAAVVAERLWSDIVANSSANKFVYMRLDTHRWRMLLRGVNVQPIWPAWCSFNPSACLEKVN